MGIVFALKCKASVALHNHQGFSDLPRCNFPPDRYNTFYYITPSTPWCSLSAPSPQLVLHLNPCHVRNLADDKLLSISTWWQQEGQAVPLHMLFKGTRPTMQTMSLLIMLSQNKNTTPLHTETAEPPSMWLWQVGKSRLQSKVLSFPQPSSPAGLGEVLFHSMTVQCKKLEPGPSDYKSRRKKKVSHINVQWIVNRRDWQWLKVERNLTPAHSCRQNQHRKRDE